MKNSVLFLMLIVKMSSAQETEQQPMSEEYYLKKIDSINNSFKYQEGIIFLEEGIAEIDVPKGYKFLDSKQSKYVLSELWGRPSSKILGMLFPKTTDPISQYFSYAIEITYSEEGYIDDEGFKDIDYDELLETMQEDTKASNEGRMNQGHPIMELLGWVSAPFYDKATNKLHWAKEIKFEGEDKHTLNYDIRVLGRKGYLNLNAIGTIDVLAAFRKDVDQILNSVKFT